MDAETVILDLNSIDQIPVIIPSPPITLNDIMASIEVVTQKEQSDKVILDSVGYIPYDTLKSKLVVWATSGFPNVYEIYKLEITTPSVCSDGISRNLSDYIQFCSGKSMQEHVAVLQQRVQDITITFANMGSYIAVVVSKA
jgi:hypothetical protein